MSSGPYFLAAARHGTLFSERRDKIEKTVAAFMTANGFPGILIAIVQDGQPVCLAANLCCPIKKLCSLYHKVGVCFLAQIAALPRKSRRYGVRLAGV